VKKKQKLRKKRAERSIKVSEMVINFAGDYINLGDTIEKRQSYLNVACVAWNISRLNKIDRVIETQRFINEYLDNNPGVVDSGNLLNDLNLLIEEKKRLYPNQNFPILHAKIIDDNTKERIIITSKKN